MPLPRPRVSLLTLLLLMTIAALTLTVGILWQEVGPLRQEVQRLRNEVGELHIEDPTKLHAIRVETDNELEWKWRIWIPEGGRYQLCIHPRRIPSQGFPRPFNTMRLDESGENVLRYRIRRDPVIKEWVGNFYWDGISAKTLEQPWVEWPQTLKRQSGVGHTTQSFGKQQTVELIRLRVSKEAKDSTQIEDPAAGFMVWIEPVP